MKKPKRGFGIIDSVESKTRSAISRGEKAIFKGLGALSKAEEESRALLEGDKKKLIKDLVKEGRKLVDSSANDDSKIDSIQSAIRGSFDDAREQAGAAFDRAIDEAEETADELAKSTGLDAIFERRVAKSLESLGYPSKDEINNLNQRIEELTVLLRNQKSES